MVVERRWGARGEKSGENGARGCYCVSVGGQPGQAHGRTNRGAQIRACGGMNGGGSGAGAHNACGVKSGANIMRVSSGR